MRVILALVMSVLLTAQVFAQDSDAPWQATVTGQIEAFRAGDAEAALGLAGESFRTNYSDAELFLRDVERSGYGPIVQSRSHSFGTYRDTGTDTVVQVVNLVGPNQRLYEAVYELRDEPGEGWRVQGVVLRQTQGLGI